MAKIGDQALGRRARLRKGVGVEQASDLSALREISILIREAHARFGIAAPSVEEVDRTRHMDPGEQPRIGRAIFAAVRQRSAHLPMDRFHFRDRGFGLLAMAIGRNRNEARGPAKAAELVAGDIAMVPHAAERLGMEHLRQQGGDPANHHRSNIAMDAPDH